MTVKTAAAGFLLSTALLFVPAVSAQAGPQAATPADGEAGSQAGQPEVVRPVVEIEGTPTGFTAPARTAAGPVTFTVRTTDPRGIRLGLVRLKPGHQLDEFLGHLRSALTEHGVEAAEAGRAVEADAVLLGGSVTAPGTTATFRQVLAPGTYYLIDYEGVSATGPITTHALTVTKTDGVGSHPGQAGRPATIAMVDTPAGPRFIAPDAIPAGRSIVVRNRTNQLAEAIFVPVKPGTDRDDVQRAFEVIETGAWPQDNPFMGLPYGVPVLSAGRAEVAQPGLAPGRYAVVTWMVDLTTGRLHAARGMHTLITVT